MLYTIVYSNYVVVIKLFNLHVSFWSKVMKKFELADVPLDKVHVSEVKIREAKKDHDKYGEMTISITAYGVMVPALARPWKDENNKLIPGHVELADGQQRYSISSDLKLATLPCKIMELTDEDIQVLQMILNEHRIPQTVKEKLEQYKKFIFMHPEYSHQEVADLFCTKVEDFRRVLKLDNLTETAMELADKGKIKASAAYALATIPKEHQTEELIKKSMEMAAGEFINWCASHRKAIRVAEKEGKKEIGPIIVPHPLTRVELIKIWESKKLEIESMDPDDDHYEYIQGQFDMIQFCLQVDPETLATKEAAKAASNAAAAEERAMKRKEMADKALADVKDKREKIKETAVAGIS